MTIIKYSDIKDKIKDVTSLNSQSSGRVIVNENFKQFLLSLQGVWEVLDAIYDTNTGQLGPLDLHSDVKTAGPDAPQPGETVVYDGQFFKSGNPGASGSATFLSQLQDVDITYPLPDKSIIQYDLTENKFKAVNLDIFTLSGGTITSSTRNEVIVKDSTDKLVGKPAGADNTFLTSFNGDVSFSQLTLDKISDLEVPATPANTLYALDYDGTKFVMKPVSAQSGNKYILRTGDEIVVEEGYQYLVHQHLFLEGGEIEVNGELVIL